MIWLLLAVLGLMLGSFFNVCIHRIPRGESIVSPPSHCPKCKKRIRIYDNVPVLSYLLLGGKCRYCQKTISPRYAVIEAITAALFVACYAKFGASIELVRALLLVCLLVVMAGIDLEHQIIPFKLSIPGLVLGGATALHPSVAGLQMLCGALLGAGFVLVAWALWRFVLAGIFRRMGVDQKEGMGGGDLPFAAMIGVFLGLRATVVALFGAVVVGVVVGLLLRWFGRTQRGQQIPFGPFLAVGALIGLFVGAEVFDWYVSLLF